MQASNQFFPPQMTIEEAIQELLRNVEPATVQDQLHSISHILVGSDDFCQLQRLERCSIFYTLDVFGALLAYVAAKDDIKN
jgi:hypothetical protein